ncbi:MAG: type VII secretion protein EccB [Nocardioides sp.]
MATKKDLVEAYSFSRRRLVTAFVSGAPGGREVEPSRPGRAIIGGLALAVLFVAGAAVLGILKSPVDIDLTKPQLVSEKESGADYVILAPEEGADPELRPVANITSAMLLLGADVSPTVVPRNEITAVERGEGIGILEAPETPPETGSLVPTGWTGCTGVVNGEPVGLKVDVAVQPQVTLTPDVSFVVTTDDGRLFLIAESTTGSDSRLSRAYAYPVPRGASADRILQNVAANSDQNAIRVPDDWLTMFPSGGALTLSTFGISEADLGKPSPFRSDPAVPGRARIGDVLEVDDQRYVLTRSGALRLDEFSAAVYLNQSFPRGRTPRSRPAEVAPALNTPDASDLPNAKWPTEVTTDRPPSELCGQLITATGAEPRVLLGTPAIGSTASAAGIPSGGKETTVDSGRGAFVLSGDWDATGATGLTLIDDRGFRYPVAGQDEQDNLGFGAVPPVVVPASWVSLFGDGVPLSIDAARCPPTSREQARPCG